MIIAWVLSLFMLISSLIQILERSVVLELMRLDAITSAGKKLIESEKLLLECEEKLSIIGPLNPSPCHIQSVGKNLWLISSQDKPSIEILVFLDEKTKQATRLNWRQEFE
ncbi:hypothetical protein FD975_01425 [Polynucleobacter sp. AP-Jannik-300A-C4]|uniref:hypothetical protein n=1 Tax=Polynucleobacter sp. AP-Jannik-300A-C4 TaxID=2576928 RepID=UPI001BFDEBAB|nr:hypothetical protein [Polynucleobacter sp. AP-Jannik-300A-C4]QWE22896.1 hypothetical protein FD975_01425 [Polynucleobacter sp. AP-Jannik-300A-C4]